MWLCLCLGLLLVKICLLLLLLLLLFIVLFLLFLGAHCFFLKDLVASHEQGAMKDSKFANVLGLLCRYPK